ncbi:MAG: hypothetical protein IPP10_12565 [Candidatus Competibacteraceae bacterium]|nr:hypothetical protein [Candidatus Competibacteraceae bacterium]MBK7982067.1 hypothetical protein [Candidatus Competibacteraceae bacterium]MBK8899325.1 hypothetical protein [Candidatus Competibacteraceae bacterium]MBK8963423.1 hypothetical protein [Candidatus Competibacteraceae bacterium]MBK9952322.1 hypothetical protein [Candidatus Competibacteraceae bacterium]
MTPRLPKRITLRPWLELALVLLLVACSRPPSPETEVRALIAAAVTAAEERNVRDLRALIAEDYADPRGLDRKAVENLIRLYVLRQQSIHLFTRVRHIEFPESERALASVVAAMAGKPVQDAGALVGLDADLYRFELELVRYGRNDWRVRSADWEPARLDDFW